MKERNWINLITSLKSDRCVLVLGPDLSADEVDSETSITYIEPALRLSSHLSQDLEDEDVGIVYDTLNSLSQQYEDAPALGPSALRARAASFYQSSDFIPSELHRVIATLPFSLILTTRHDPVMEEILRNEGKIPKTGRYSMRASQKENPEIGHTQSVQEPCLFRLFGDPSEPESLILTENDILDFVISIASGRPSLPIGLVKTLKLSGQSFLFLGFGVKDWYLRVLLKILLRVLEIDRSGFAVASESLNSISEADKATTVLFFRRGKRVEIEDSDSLEFVKNLKRRLEVAGGVPAPTVLTGPLIRAFICHAKEDAMLAKELQSNLVERGFDAWLDAHDLEGGQNWDAEIQAELESTDFVLVIHSDSLYRKTDSYVNKEIHLAVERSLRIRGEYIIPLRTNSLKPENIVTELAQFQDMSLDSNKLDEDVQALVSVLKRAHQRRVR